jgi:hypothetical protein
MEELKRRACGGGGGTGVAVGMVPELDLGLGGVVAPKPQRLLVLVVVAHRSPARGRKQRGRRIWSVITGGSKGVVRCNYSRIEHKYESVKSTRTMN